MRGNDDKHFNEQEFVFFVSLLKEEIGYLDKEWVFKVSEVLNKGKLPKISSKFSDALLTKSVK